MKDCLIQCLKLAYMFNKNSIKVAAFAAVFLAASPMLASVAHGYGGAIGGGGGGGSNPLPGADAVTSIPTVTTTASGDGQVLGASTYNFSVDLTIGSTGADVEALQNLLIAAGYSIPAGATGYFGAQTEAAVKLFQTAHGLPSTGYVGPLTRTVLNEGTTPTSTDEANSMKISNIQTEITAALAQLAQLQAELKAMGQ